MDSRQKHGMTLKKPNTVLKTANKQGTIVKYFPNFVDWQEIPIQGSNENKVKIIKRPAKQLYISLTEFGGIFSILSFTSLSFLLIDMFQIFVEVEYLCGVILETSF